MKDFFTDGVRVSGGEILPFSLCIIVGRQDRSEEIMVTSLSKEKNDFAKHLYELEEFRPIIIQAQIPPEEKLYLFWDVALDEVLSPESVFLFTEHLTTAYVYDQNLSEEGYPWSCGIYAFYVTYAEQDYWGGFHILPKNLTNQQLISLHQLIENEVADLAFEHFEHHQVFDGNIIELKAEYAKLLQRFSYEAQKIFFYRNWQEDISNHLFLMELRAFLISGQQWSKGISDKEVMLEWLGMEAKVWDLTSQITHRLRYSALGIFSNPSFGNIKETPKNTREWEERKVLPIQRKVLKPTFLLYEYYCFFFMLQILRDMGYIPEEMDAVSKRRLFYSNHEQFSAKIHLSKNQMQMDLIYNEIIEPLVYEDFPNSEGLFSLVDKRRPDIRLDLFRVESGQRIFLSTLILEVKYSPIFNIYQKKTKTKVMEQLKKYRSIVYQHKNKKGRGIYDRNPVYEVICLYPGHDKLPVVLDTPIALYIQCYPREIHEKNIQMVGKQQICQLLKRWIQEKSKKKQ